MYNIIVFQFYYLIFLLYLRFGLLSSIAGIQVQKIDPTTNKVLAVYNTKRDVVKKYQNSYAKLNSLFTSDNEIYNGFIWKLLQPQSLS